MGKTSLEQNRLMRCLSAWKLTFKPLWTLFLTFDDTWVSFPNSAWRVYIAPSRLFPDIFMTRSTKSSLPLHLLMSCLEKWLLIVVIYIASTAALTASIVGKYWKPMLMCSMNPISLCKKILALRWSESSFVWGSVWHIAFATWFGEGKYLPVYVCNEMNCVWKFAGVDARGGFDCICAHSLCCVCCVNPQSQKRNEIIFVANTISRTLNSWGKIQSHGKHK